MGSHKIDKIPQIDLDPDFGLCEHGLSGHGLGGLVDDPRFFNLVLVLTIKLFFNVTEKL